MSRVCSHLSILFPSFFRICTDMELLGSVAQSVEESKKQVETLINRTEHEVMKENVRTYTHACVYMWLRCFGCMCWCTCVNVYICMSVLVRVYTCAYVCAAYLCARECAGKNMSERERENMCVCVCV